MLSQGLVKKLYFNHHLESWSLFSIDKKAGAGCECGSLASLLHTPLTPGICQTVSTLMRGELVWVTCERSYDNDMLPSSLSGEVIINKIKKFLIFFSI